METEQIVRILHEKSQLFFRFLEISQQMCTDPIDDISHNMQERLSLQERIEALDEKLEPLFSADPAAKEAAKSQCNYSGLAPEYAKIYDAAFQLHGVLSSIQRLEPQLKDRLLRERSMLLEKLESSQRSSGAAANRYYQSVHLEAPIPLHGSDLGRA